MKTISIIFITFLFAGIALADDAYLSSSEDKAAISKVPCKPEPNIILQGGDTVEDATVIDTVPIQITGTTTGYNHDYDEMCPYGSISPDVVYSYMPPYDMPVDISTCEGSSYDTKLIVYENEVTWGNPYACNDDLCPGYLAYIETIILYEGNTYFIVVDGYGGDHGEYVLDIFEWVMPPSFCEGADFQQPPHSPEDDWGAVISDAGSDESYIVYESFSSQTTISTLRFIGIDAFYDGDWSDCLEEPMIFKIQFYVNDNGMPGIEHGSYTVETNPIPTGQLYAGYESNEYYCVIEPSIAMENGWVSIQGISDPQDCMFLWMSGTDGDGESYQWQGGPDLVPTGYDRGLCLYSTVSEIEDEEQLPTDQILLSAYPNPFNSIATIEYSVTNPGNVKISIYNQLGELVTELLNETKQPGQYSINWEASDYSSGIYFARLESSDYNKSVKFTFLK